MPDQIVGTRSVEDYLGTSAVTDTMLNRSYGSIRSLIRGSRTHSSSADCWLISWKFRGAPKLSMHAWAFTACTHRPPPMSTVAVRYSNTTTDLAVCHSAHVEVKPQSLAEDQDDDEKEKTTVGY